MYFTDLSSDSGARSGLGAMAPGDTWDEMSNGDEDEGWETGTAVAFRSGSGSSGSAGSLGERAGSVGSVGAGAPTPGGHKDNTHARHVSWGGDDTWGGGDEEAWVPGPAKLANQSRGVGRGATVGTAPTSVRSHALGRSLNTHRVGIGQRRWSRSRAACKRLGLLLGLVGTAVMVNSVVGWFGGGNAREEVDVRNGEPGRTGEDRFDRANDGSAEKKVPSSFQKPRIAGGDVSNVFAYASTQAPSDALSVRKSPDEINDEVGGLSGSQTVGGRSETANAESAERDENVRLASRGFDDPPGLGLIDGDFGLRDTQTQHEHVPNTKVLGTPDVPIDTTKPGSDDAHLGNSADVFLPKRDDVRVGNVPFEIEDTELAMEGRSMDDNENAVGMRDESNDGSDDGETDASKDELELVPNETVDDAEARAAFGVMLEEASGNDATEMMEALNVATSGDEGSAVSPPFVTPAAGENEEDTEDDSGLEETFGDTTEDTAANTTEDTKEDTDAMGDVDDLVTDTDSGETEKGPTEFAKKTNEPSTDVPKKAKLKPPSPPPVPEDGPDMTDENNLAELDKFMQRPKYVAWSAKAAKLEGRVVAVAGGTTGLEDDDAKPEIGETGDPDDPDEKTQAALSSKTNFANVAGDEQDLVRAAPEPET